MLVAFLTAARQLERGPCVSIHAALLFITGPEASLQMLLGKLVVHLTHPVLEKRVSGLIMSAGPHEDD